MLPHVILHNAVSVDGRLDWFPADVAKFYELAAYWKEDATLAGSDTLLKAYPEEKIMPEDKEAFDHVKTNPDDTRPLLIVADSRGRLRHILHMLRHEPYWRNIVILTSSSTPKPYLDYLGKRHIDYLTVGIDHVDFTLALSEINSRYGIKSLRVDSGGTLNGILIRAGLANEVSVLVHPFLVGGNSPRSIFNAADLIANSGVKKLRLIHLEQLPNDHIWLRYEILQQ
jgi:2,5-diamino-6-(ribosylamino)-4(3H)-pyrimidinone 5'-phosphate reductase